MKRFVPNFITCLNLFCGCVSIVFAFYGRLEWAAYLIFLAAAFDFLDGFAARTLKAYSELGKQLDSLADVVSFGVAPASIMFELMLSASVEHELFQMGWLIAFSAYFIAVFSALRLAKFNIDTRQSDSFIGLPTPANALFICSLVFITSIEFFEDNIYFLLAVVVVFSYLLVAELPLFSLKFKTFDWKSNKIRYFFVAFSILILLVLNWAGLAFVILSYIILSIISNILQKNRLAALKGR